ncbi:Ig-like domain-containing protein, partial [Patescibacteria group bacterium]|nr:Ig-like domain-containing protein [Patescibacteria group bacterium]
MVKRDAVGSVFLPWAANLESDLTGYKVHYGSPTGYSFSNSVDIGNVTNYILSGVTLSDTIAVTAYDINADGTDDQVEGHESWFSYANPPPESPTSLTATVGDQQVTVDWTASVSPGILRYKVYSDTSSPASTLIDSVSGISTSFIHTGLQNGTTYYYRVTAVDSNLIESDDFSNEVNATPFKPFKVVSVNPAQNALNISKSTDIAATFNYDVNPATIDSTTFVVHASQTGLHRGTYSYNAGTKTVTLDPRDDFAVGEEVSVTLTTGIKSAGGITLINPYTWAFTVEVEDGSGIFAEQVTYDVEPNPEGITLVDLDGDADQDLVV